MKRGWASRSPLGIGDGLFHGAWVCSCAIFRKSKYGELLHVVAVGEAVVPEDVAVVPELLDDLLRVSHCFQPALAFSRCALMACARAARRYSRNWW